MKNNLCYEMLLQKQYGRNKIDDTNQRNRQNIAQ